MSRICYCFIVLITVSLGACFSNAFMPSKEVTIQDTGTDADYKAQLRLQKDFMFVINPKGHPRKFPSSSLFSQDRYLFDSDYTMSLKNALSQSFFATKKRLSSVEEFDPDSRPYVYLLETHSWDPCVLYIMSINLEDKSYNTPGSPGQGVGPNNSVYIPGSSGTSVTRLNITFTIQLISYGKYQHQYTVSKQLDYPDTGEDIFKYLELNFKNIFDEFSDLRFGY